MALRSTAAAHRLAVPLAAATLCAGCILVTDFDIEPAATGGAGVGGTGAAGGIGRDGGGGTAGGGGTDEAGGSAATGGAATCGGADLASDPENCGSCGFLCESECVAGRCSSTIDLGGLGSYVTSVLPVGDTLFFVLRNGTVDYSGTVWTLPLDFTSESSPTLLHPVENAVGSLAAGTVGAHPVYFAGQVSKMVYACSESDCIETSLGASIQTQVNGMVALDDTLYLVAASSDNRLVSFPLDTTTGAPVVDPTYLVDTYSPAIANDGVVQLFHLAAPPRLYWASYDSQGSVNGCVYEASIASLPVSPMTCWSPSFYALGFSVAADGTVYAQNGLTQLIRFAGDPPQSSVFATNATWPRDVDDLFLYATDTQSHAVRALPLDGSQEAAPTPVPPDNPTALSAAHPSYLYYGAGPFLVRSPKPSP